MTPEQAQEMLAKIGADTRRLLNGMRTQGSEELIAATLAISLALIERVNALSAPERVADSAGDPEP